MLCPVHRYVAVGSTNSVAMARARADERAPFWVLAERQTAGRGRSGRGWLSPEGSLSATLLWPLEGPLGRGPELSFVAGVALHDAVVAQTGDRGAARARVRLKWPNDLLADNAKCGGILLEGLDIAGVWHVAVGIGVNVTAVPAVAEGAVTSLHAAGYPHEIEAFGKQLRALMDTWLEVWRGPGGFPLIREAWLARATAIGQAMSVHCGDRLLEGAFAGLDDDGALLISVRGVTQKVTVGDVTLPV